MDPSKSSNSSAPEWADEKSSISRAAPPPYEPNLAGYPQSVQGYPQSVQGYPQSVQGYQPQPQGYAPQYGGFGQPQYPTDQQYPGQPGTVTIQPTVYVTQGPLANPVNDYLCYSIFTTLCCCLPLGIAALIYSSLTRDANYRGDQIVAEKSSRLARTLNHVALGIGIGFIILVIVFSVVVPSVAFH